MKQQNVKQIILIVGVIAVLVFFGLAYEGKAGIALFNNTSQTQESSEAGEPITYLISNLTRPAEVEITEEDIRRIPKVEGVVQSSGTGDSSEYEETVLNAFLRAADRFSGAGTGMETYKIETFDLLTDPDFANPAFLGRDKGVKVSIVYNSSPSVLEDTNWAHLSDASTIAYEMYDSTAGSDTGYVTVSYMFADKKSPRFQTSLTAEEAKRFNGDWTEDNYLPLPAWSAVTIDSSANIVPYENIDTIVPAVQGIDSISSDAISSGSVTDEYDLYISKDNLEGLLGRYSTEMQDHIQKISGYSTDSDFTGMADASEQMMIQAAEIEDEITHLPIAPQYADVADNFLEGVRNYQYAGSYFWYGATFTEIDPIKTGNTYVQKGFSNNNNALEALDMQTIETAVFELPNGKLFPDAIYMYENHVYPDSKKKNDISVKFSSLSYSRMYTLKQDDKNEKNVAGYGYKYVFPVIEIHHLGFRGGGSSRDMIITTPDQKDFTIIYNGEEYKSITPSPYVGRKLDPTTYIEPAGYPYYKVKLDRKGTFEGVLVFQVPDDFDPAKAYMKLDLSNGETVWHMVPR
ncbi:hypothetical protein [Methanogenium cariaci]